jgi:hypothetical protein
MQTKARIVSVTVITTDTPKIIPIAALLVPFRRPFEFAAGKEE